jgi:hypothetical protein
VDRDDADHRVEERESAPVERLRAENAALRAELERMRARYEAPSDPPPREKVKSSEEPERFALVGPGPRKPAGAGPTEEAWDSLGATLCRLLEERRPTSRWRYYGHQRLVPEGMTFFYAHEALRKMWGERPDNSDPPDPQAYRRLTAAEQDERDGVLQAALRRVDQTLERSESLYAQGHDVAAVGLLKQVDLLLARFRLALARAEVGDAGWQDVLENPDRDAEFEAWVAAQIAPAQ